MTLAQVEIKDAASVQRWLLDNLPVSRRFTVGPARIEEMPDLMEQASRDIPGLTGKLDGAIRVQRLSKSIFSVRNRGALVGSLAFLFLNESGFEALLAGRFPIASPDADLLAREDEKAAALYAWALCMPGSTIGAMGNIMEVLRRPLHAEADIYARPATLKGEQFMSKTGFGRLGPKTPLWVYRRPKSFEQAAE
jgi:hypothetical protein